MNPVHKKPGRYYWATYCQNPKCRTQMAVVEVPARPTAEEDANLKASLRGLRVRCFACTQETPIQVLDLILLQVV